MVAIIKKILITGADGFIGKNLSLAMNVAKEVSVSKFLRGESLLKLQNLVDEADFVVHLAAENRPENEIDFKVVNYNLTMDLCDFVKQKFLKTGKFTPIIFTSSTQSKNDSAYGQSKRLAEKELEELYNKTGNPCFIFNLPGVFGKWARPNYNSVVATFCHNISRGLPIDIHNHDTSVNLVYVDDVVQHLMDCMESQALGFKWIDVKPEYNIKLVELAKLIEEYNSCRNSLYVSEVGKGFNRALYSTFISYLPEEEFSYDVADYSDPRGVFVEFVKTTNSGQFSYFTAHPGVTRGGHYHNTKTEKFLVLKGNALFKFRNLNTGKVLEIKTEGKSPRIVDTIPGWAHDVTNVGSEEMLVMLWANEVFDPKKPDTFSCEV